MIAIDITKDNIYALEVKVAKSTVEIQKSRMIPLDEEIIGKDGFLVDKATPYFIKAVEGMSSKQVTITSSRIGEVYIEHIIPYSKKESEVENMVKSLVSTQATEGSILDYRVLDIVTEEKEKKLKVGVYIANGPQVETLEQIVINTGKVPYRVNPSQNAILNVCESYLTDDTIIFVNPFAKIIKAHIYNRPYQIVTRTTNVEEKEKEQEQEIDLSFMRTVGSPESSETNTMTVIPSANLGNNIAETAADQISKMIQFQAIKHPGKGVNSIYLCGDMANLEIAKEIERYLPGEQIKMLKLGFNTDILDYKIAYAIGAAL